MESSRTSSTNAKKNFQVLGLDLSFSISVYPLLCMGISLDFFKFGTLEKYPECHWDEIFFHRNQRIYKVFFFCKAIFQSPSQDVSEYLVPAQKIIWLLKWLWFFDRATNTGFLLSKAWTFP